MSTRSFSLSAYRALVQRNAFSKNPEWPDRPAGELVWFHLGHIPDCEAILDLADRLTSLRPTVSVLVTYAQDDAEDMPGGSNITATYVLPAPDEHPRAVSAFLDHWHPDLALWVWGGLRPNLVDEAVKRNVPLHLVSADTAGFDGRRDRWLPELAKSLMQSFSSISVRSLETVTRLSRFGVKPGTIALMTPLRPSGRMLNCDQTDLDEMSAHVSGRPVWLAARTAVDEWEDVLAAHRIALRSAHRLLLVLNPADPKALSALRSALDAHDFSYAVWGDGEWPVEATQVLIADLPDELGLWYRTAGVSFLGKSLSANGGGTEPMAAAALGTAILYGPNVRKHLASYSRLANQGAARIVNDGASLGAAVSRLIAPDQAASMAHAGWEVVSEGAETVDRIVDLVQDSLDAVRAPT